MLQDSVKKDDPLKVGRFGLGFKSVFHMTGVYINTGGFFGFFSFFFCSTLHGLLDIYKRLYYSQCKNNQSGNLEKECGLLVRFCMTVVLPVSRTYHTSLF